MVFFIVCPASQFKAGVYNTSLSLSYVSPPPLGVISGPHKNDHEKKLIFNSLQFRVYKSYPNRNIYIYIYIYIHTDICLKVYFFSH